MFSDMRLFDSGRLRPTFSAVRDLSATKLQKMAFHVFGTAKSIQLMGYGLTNANPTRNFPKFPIQNILSMETSSLPLQAKALMI